MSSQLFFNNQEDNSNSWKGYLEISDILQIGLVWLNEEGRLLAMNSQLKRELGYSDSAEFSQKTIFQIAPYLTFLEWREIWKQLVANQEFTFLAECITRQGTVYPVDMRAKLLRLQDQDICFCLIDNLIVSRAYQELLEITSTITRVGSWQWNMIQNRLLLGKEVYSLLELPDDTQITVRNLLRSLKNMTSKSEFSLFKEKLRHSLLTGQQFDFELSVVLPVSKQNCRFRLVGVPTFKDGQTINLYGAIQDISSIALRTEQMYLMEYSVDNAYEMIYWVQPDGKICYVNNKTCKILGYSREELLDMESYTELVADYNDNIWPSWDKFKEQQVWQGEIALKAKDGTVIPAYTIADYTNYRGTELACIFTRDLRKKKRREQLAQLTQYLLNQANDMIYWFDSDGVIEYANQAFCEKLGYQMEEVLGRRGREFFPEISLEQVDTAWQTLRSGQSIFGEYIITGKNNKKIPIEASISLTNFEGKEYCTAIIRDLTERKQKEKEIQEHNRLLRISNYALDKTSEMIYWAKMDGVFININQAFCEKTGYTEQELREKNLRALFSEIPPDLWEVRLEKIKNGEPLIGEASMAIKDGTLLPIKYHVSLTEYAGEPCLCGFLSDISELKHLEAALRERGHLIKMNRDSLANESSIVYWKRSDGSFIHANAAFFTKLGFTPKELSALQVDAIYEDFDLQENLQRWNAVLRVGVRTGDFALRAKDGRRIDAQYQASAVNFEGEVSICYIVQEKKEMQSPIDSVDEQERIQKLIDYMPTRVNDLIYWTNSEGIIVYANDLYCQIIGYEREELIGKHVLNFYPSVTLEQAAMGFEMIRQSQNMVSDSVITTRNHEKIPVEQSASVIYDGSKEYFSIILRDLTEEKRKEQELSERSRLLDMASYSLNHANEMIYWLDSNGNFLSFNDTMLGKLGYTTEELKKISPRDLFKNNSDKDDARSWAALQSGKPIQGEGIIFSKNNTSFPIEYYILPVELNGESFVCGRLTDISERKEKEKELHKAFEQIKELKEKLESENLILKEDIKLGARFNDIISTSDSYKKVLKKVEQVADTEATVMILGETGTGKELLARALHQLSRRVQSPMVKVNCGALPESLIESELFGHEKGAFTGAYQQKKGRFELADKGTIFLDEIGDLPLDLQTKLLRVLQEGEFDRVGGTKTIKVDVRVIAATNRNLEQLVQEGKFRQDLFYRLNVFPIYNIPLRERKEDIPLLVRHFAEKFSQKTGKRINNIPQKSLDKLKNYYFPGNVRELENIIERAVILSSHDSLEIDSAFSTDSSAAKKEEIHLQDGNFKSLEELQREYIIQALRHAEGQITGERGAAKLLKMNDKTLYSKIKKLEIERHEYLS